MSFTYSLKELDPIFICQSLTLCGWNSLRRILLGIKYSIDNNILHATCVKEHTKRCREWEGVRTDPFAFIHVSLVTHQYLVDIVRSMLLNVADPIPNVWK